MTRTAVVTGGGTGIGRAVAGRLVRDGLHVVVTGRRRDVLETTAKEIGARAVVFDATDPAAIEAALPDLPPSVDVLVNNAGGNTDLGAPSPEGLAALRDAWLANLSANLLSAVLVTTALTPRLADQARVITLGSIAARNGAAGYGAAKAGVEAWSVGLARELGGRGITSNVVSPGYIEDTEFFTTDAGSALSPQRREWLVAQTANGRPGTPADLAATVSFLASPESGHITAQVLHVNGGAHRGL
ncbi:3-oxoacyl-[acyl-carrier protein] reductase [Crossiella equi]|uniref:3-oxoacyl-[acyl-carrier protein] reductase n=1 Tax=Crossiella equi TaxID=130796 RepID=A0ABS5AK93_9PSEU|nr:SDR family oxidoreductase [Crossiella equi]MBP2476990.1 3-oxoacyl-[acyl-carrier protein] reductase [Crossiella equi]